MKKDTNFEDFKKSLEGKTLQELQEIEKQIVAEADKIDKEISETTFDLPKENYETVADAIKYFLNKQTVQWQYTLGMVGMYDFWDGKHQTKIPYAQLDSILRTLGGMQFTGYEEWAKVIAINKFFEGLREQYVEVTQKAYDVATRHQMLMDAMGLNTPVTEQ